MEVLPAEGALLEAARELLRRTTVFPGAPLAVERLGADAYDHLGGRRVELVAVERGEVVGSVFGQVRDRLVVEGGAWCAEPLLYLADLRVRADERRKRVALRLLDALAARAVALGARRGFCLVEERNEPMLRLLASERSRLSGEPRHLLTTWARLVPPGGAALPEGWSVVGPEGVELDPLVDRPPRWLAPARGVGELGRLLAAHPELRFAVRDDAPRRPRFGLWDQRRLRRLRGVVPEGVAGWMLGAWRAWAWVQGGPGPPRRDETCTAVEVVLDGDEPLEDRLEVGAAWASLAGCQVAHALSGPDEPPPEGGVAFARRSWLVPLGIDGAVPLAPDARKPGVDPGFL